MGRSKNATPSRIDITAGSSEILGRYQQQQAGSNPEQDENIQDAATTAASYEHAVPLREHAGEGYNNDDDDDEVVHPDGGGEFCNEKCMLRPTIAAIEDEMIRLQEQRSTRRRQSRKKTKKKSVTFAGNDGTMLESIIPRHSELRIRQEETDNGETTATLLYNPHGPAGVLTEEAAVLCCLKSYHLSNSGTTTRVLVLVDDYDSSETRPSSQQQLHVLTTSRAIRDIFEYFYSTAKNDDENSSPSLSFLQALTTCVVDKGWIQVVLVVDNTTNSTISLKLFLTPLALLEQDSQFSPKTMKQKNTRVALQEVLSHLYPSSLQPSPSSLLDITAKHVYECTDNRALLRSLQQQLSLSAAAAAIPGLNPTLRPYQARAVDWMLRREQHDKKSVEEEWKVAWVVLPLGVPLYSWTLQQQDFVLYCPWTGWLATTLEQAKAYTTTTGMNVSSLSCRGGILAESMGLGKTVEVLACIVSHVRRTNCSSPSSNNDPACKKKLQFEEPLLTDMLATAAEVGAQNVGLVGSVEEFGDADVSDDENGNVSASPGVVPVPVTPDVKKKIPERWMNDDVVGSCICGQLIDFTYHSRPIVLCQSCNEPMHLECSLYDRSTSCGERLYLRRTFTSQTIECFLASMDEHCPCCVAVARSKQETLIQSGSTLIVTPAAILHQWQREIQRHTPQLNVLVYPGIEKATKSKNESIKLIHPKVLAQADIVLMTFDALMSELGHSDDNPFVGQQQFGNETPLLRGRKRYRVVPSPLLSINWWRVCLDEAQRVETPTAGTARMAQKLQAVHRWCVTGTPIGRGKLQDLYGLLLFLQIQPLSDRWWFQKLLVDTRSSGNVLGRMEHALKDVMWRSTKACDLVREQMGVPEQVERKVMLQLSSIEKHFYQLQLESTLEAASELKSKKRKASQMNVMTEHLHRLRAACCHPQVGSSGVAVNTGGRSSSKRRVTKRQKASKGGPATGSHSSANNSSVSTRVMTMEQILERFIEDARLKCEEAQRLAIMHTNAMAALCKLQVEAKGREECSIQESDLSLFNRSGKLYEEALTLSEQNATPTLAIGEVVMTGSTWFCFPCAVIRNGCGCLWWKWSVVGEHYQSQPVWSRLEFEGPSRKLTQVRMRLISRIPDEVIKDADAGFVWKLLRPKEITFQVANVAISGAFVDVATIVLPATDGSDEWTVITGFLTNKSKGWRLLVKSFYDDEWFEAGDIDIVSNAGFFTGIELELFEADIASDPLQRLHSLHNAAHAFEAVLQIKMSKDFELDSDDIQLKLTKMREEVQQIESLYMEHPTFLHDSCMMRLEESVSKRRAQESELFEVTRETRSGKIVDCWEDEWWSDFIGICLVHGSDIQKEAIYDRLSQEIEGFRSEIGDPAGIVQFPAFRDLHGFRAALQMRMGAIRIGIGKKGSRKTHTALSADSFKVEDTFVQPRSTQFKCPTGAHGECVKSILQLSAQPDNKEQFENSHCRVCKEDWFQSGPECRHCKLGEQLRDLVPDNVTYQVLLAVHAVLKSSVGTAILKAARVSANVEQRAKRFFDVLEAEKRERVCAWRMWRVHLDLLNDLDELNQCKSTIRLTYPNEDLSTLTEDQLNAVVVPFDINARHHEHAAKQAMSLGDLRRSKDTLRYLKNQTTGTEESKTEEENCAVCLSAFDGERAVLRCGHSFHSPCLEKLKGNNRCISCPMRCKVRTTSDEVMFASTKSMNDGTRTKRPVKGSWGTKVTRMVSDMLDVRDQGEKAVVFTQWEDMLDIIQEALSENGISCARPKGTKRIGETIQLFRAPDCSALLLNIKNGAEGLTLVEATHVFMVEPLLNNGLDSQAINRVHRIGQKRKTFIWRYVVEGTIEVKIDQVRIEHEGDELEDEISAGRKSAFKAGGIDGGFQSQEQLVEMLTP